MAQNGKITLGILSVASPQYVFVGKGDKILIQKEILDFNNGSNKILPYAMECLEQTGIALTEVNYFLALAGPGSLTGIRAGLSPIRAWGYSLGKSVFALSSLEVMAFGMDKPTLALLPAKKGEYWVQSFSDGFKDEPMIVSEDKLLEKDLPDWTWVCSKPVLAKKAKVVIQPPLPEQALGLSMQKEPKPWTKAIPQYHFEMTND